MDFGFIDFSKIRKQQPELIEEDFKSIMLGYESQKGKWLKVFDSLFYIKENHGATPIER